jgi:ATP-binding cassette subfamily F protein 3
MPLINIKNLSFNFGTETIFSDLETVIFRKQKIGLVGANGSGKTTLLRLILGQITPDLGQIHKPNKAKTALMPQEPYFPPEKTVQDELYQAVEPLLNMQKKLDQHAKMLETLKDDQLHTAMNLYDQMTAQFEAAGGYSFENKLKQIVAGVGIDMSILSAKCKTLSGGQKCRLSLAKVLLSDADLLLLDEPTNHLDWNGILWLERFLRSYKGACLIVSHDRFLLDRIAQSIIEIADKKTWLYKGNYSSYRTQKSDRIEQQTKENEQNAKFITKTQDFIDRNRNFKGMQKVARGRQKMLDKFQHQATSPLAASETKKLRFNLAELENKGQKTTEIIQLKNLVKNFDDLTLFENLNLTIYTGQRLGIVGPNGTGKSTLLKIITNLEKPSKGDINIKKDAVIGYMDQTAQSFDEKSTVIDEIAKILPKETPAKLRNILAGFLFTGDDVFKNITQLSGGERNRLALCKLTLLNANVIILDEPTNHLDIPAVEALEQALSAYTGTLIIVSHDRYFIQRCSDRLLVLGTDPLGKKHIGTFEIIEGTFEEYEQIIEQRIKENEAAAPQKQRKEKKNGIDPKKAVPPELKKFNSWTPEKIENEIVLTEESITQLEQQFTNEDVYKDHQKTAKLHEEIEEKKNYTDILYRAYERKVS